MGFLSALGKAVNEQFGFGENSVTSLDSIDGKGNRVEPFGLLGEFAKKFDRSAHRNYIEDGFIRNVRPRLREVWLQQPDMTVIIKKRMFSSLVENYRMDHLEEKERLFIRATKTMFQNKCRAISAYEKLSKVEQLVRDSGQINSFMLPTIIAGFSEFDDALSGLTGGIIDPQAKATLETLRRVFSFSEPASTTTWVTDRESPFLGALGEGTGVFELTTVANVNTKSSVQFGAGNASLSIEDPYKLMVITNDDIDVALKDSTNWFKSGVFGRFTEIETRRLIENQKQELNQIRQQRGASRIRFIISPTTITGRRVRALMETGFIGGTNVPGGENSRPSPEIQFQYNSGLAGFNSQVEVDPIAREGNQGLNDEEVLLFKEIISNIFLLVGFQNTTRDNVLDLNSETLNYVRRKMRLHFANKPMIQPMDVVNIFVSSKSRTDEKLTVGFDNTSRGFSFGQKLDSLVRNINMNLGNLSSMFNGNSSMIESEKMAIVGADFPTWLWRIYRNDFTRQAAGTSIFVGIVQQASRGYSASDGKYMLNVTCEDNSGYFNKSQINIRPALDVFNSNLYDPLTPFDISFDAATGVVQTDIQSKQFPQLLPENLTLLNSNAIRFKNGPFRGQKINELLYKSKEQELTPQSQFNTFRRVLSDPSGFVYRWKEGISSLTKTERAYPESSVQQEFSPLLTQSPFAGQDVMNVLSLLVTGQPYNYNSFLRAALNNANSLINKNDQTNKDTALTYIESFTRDLSKRNSVWGNFIPFKKLVINSAADAFIRSTRIDVTKIDHELNRLIRERASLIDDLAIRNQGFAQSPAVVSRDRFGQFTPDVENPDEVYNRDLYRKINRLDQQIERKKALYEETISELLSAQDNGRIKIIGDDLSFDPGITEATPDKTLEQQQQDRNEFRRKINFLTLRRNWKVKANDDVNLFIVDDQYDKSFDIQAFERKLAGKLKLFQSEYDSVDDKIKKVATLLGLEIFADTQGHIQVRPPQYNRIPSSVFFRMFRDKERTGFQVFPQYLESLFFNNLQSQIERIETIEDEIRLRVLSLGIVPNDATSPDDAIEKFLRGTSNLDTSANTSFSFTSRPNGKIGGNDFKSFIAQSKPDLSENNTNRALLEQSEAFINASRSTRVFDTASRIDKLNNFRDIGFKAAFSQKNQQRISEIRKRLEREKGVRAPDQRDLFSNDRLQGQFGQLDAINVMSQISNFIAERQKLLVLTSNTIKSLSEGARLNEEGKGATAALFPSLNRDQSIPKIIEHMIEDESNHDFGPNSGDRFVVKDSQILNLNIEETAPPYTLVEVNGLFGEGFVEPQQSLTLTNQGGNAVTSAFAIDYDMWRMYGFRGTQPVPAPFFSDPDTQCAPYAVFLLNLARKNILKGSVDLIGNEFYQPGDVIYIESEDLLFYVDDVNHSFNYSGTFTTSLKLSYGHNPGEYIPTMLDIVGKALYTNKDLYTSYRSNRFGNSNGEIPVGVIVYDSSEIAGNFDFTLERLLSGTLGNANKKALNNIFMASTGALSPLTFRRQKPILKIRIYFDSKNVPFADSNLRSAAEVILQWLQNPQQAQSSKGLINIDIGETELPNRDNIEIDEVDVSIDVEHSPSEEAVYMARMLLEQGNFPRQETNIDFTEDIAVLNESRQIDNRLYSNVIDVWLAFEDVPETNESTKPGAEGQNQAAQEAQEIRNSARNRRAGT